MRPTPEFINMIVQFFTLRQSAITADDLSKHDSVETEFYSISQAEVTQKNRVVRSLQPFNEMIFIHIDKGALNVTINNGYTISKFQRTSPLTYEVIDGKGVVYWSALNGFKTYVIAKLMSDDGCVQIKIIEPGSEDQKVHNVCELPLSSIKKYAAINSKTR